MPDERTPEDVTERLATIEQYLDHLRTANPYYDWLGTEVVDVERGHVRLRQPHDDRVRPPEVGPAEGINGGILVTLADAAGMAAVIAEALEPIPLATTGVNMSFHDGADEAHLVDASVIEFGSTLATARVEIRPESERDAADPNLIASGETTARLFE